MKLEFFINELFECCLSIDCERGQIEQENDLFQLQNIQTSQSQSQVTKIDHKNNFITSSSLRTIILDDIILQVYLCYSFHQNLFSFI
jgi:hypothetical protein